MLSLAVALLLSPDVVVATHEPRPATPWVQSVRANCGADVLTVDGYGGGRPLAMAVRVRVNGRPVAGAGVARLVADLANRRAAYRLQILCGGAGRIILRFDAGEKEADGPVRFQSAAANFQGSRLTSYSGLQDSSAEGFWFR